MPAAQRLALDTGHGVALCFSSNALDALSATIALRRRPIADINGRANVVGGGINIAQRVMGFAAPNRLLALATFRQAVAQASPVADVLFHPQGRLIDKHGRVHELHNLEVGASSPRRRAAAPPHPCPPCPARSSSASNTCSARKSAQWPAC